MAKEKKLVEAITSMEEDFAQWYTDVVNAAHLATYSNVKGCIILEPNGYELWDSIRTQMDKMFKETGHRNVAMPMLIPENLMKKESDLINYIQNDKFDDIYTPTYAITPLLKYIPKGITIWECCDFGKSDYFRWYIPIVFLLNLFF